MEVAVARAAAVALALTVAGCTHQAMLYGEAVPSGCSADGPFGSEDCMGWYIDRLKMLDRAEYDDAGLARYVSSVGERVARATGDRRRWTFRLTDDADPQAEANISTTVYITRGALARLRDEAELAGMLGHEIGHVLGGHARDAVVEHGRGVRESSWDLQSQRDDEIQADELAVLFTQRAGYDPHAVESMLRALAAGEPADDPDRGADPHPRWTERLARIQAFAMHFHGGERRAKEYLAQIQNLVVGDDPRNAKVLGNAVVFARTGLAIDLPEGWISTLGSDGGVGIDYRGDLTLRLAVRPARAKATIKSDPDHDSFFETAEGHGRLLVIEVDGKQGEVLAKRVRRAVRPVRPDEVAKLEPHRIDLSAPRVLWPDPVVEEKHWNVDVTWPDQKKPAR